MTEAQTLRDYIAHKQAQIDDLIKRHGQGVRPGWVSEEIMMLTFYKQDAKDQLAAMEASNATDNSNH